MPRPPRFEDHPIRIAAVALPLLLWSAPARADQDAQAWTNVSLGGRVYGPLLVQADASIRVSDASDGLHQIDLAIVAGTQIADGVQLYAGYVRSLRYSRTALTTVENRPRVQLNADLGTIAGGRVALRWRGEMRMREDLPGIGWRTRAQLRWTRPFRAGGKTALVLGHESFLNFNRTRFTNPGYDRARNFVAVSFPLIADVKGEVGYLNQHRFVRGGRDLSEHNAQFSLGWSF